MSGSGFNKGNNFSKLVRISSSERLSGTPTNFIFDFGQNLQQIKKISIETVTFFNNFFNITSLNNSFTYITTDGSGNHNMELDIVPGRYTASTLLDAIISGTGLNLSYSINPITNRVSLTYTTGGGITAVNFIQYVGHTSENPLSYLGFVLTDTSNPVYGSYGTLTNAQTLVATNMPRMYGPSMVFIASNKLAPSNSFDEKGQISDILVGIPVTTSYLGLNEWRCLQDELCEIDFGRPRNLEQVDIVLQDREGNILDLQGGSLTIGLRAWYNY